MLTAQQKEMLRRIKPSNGLKILLSYSKYYEQNRQEHIRVDNEIYFNTGWLPSGPVGWWRFR